MKVILVRHGQTEWNLQSRIQGWMDSPLTNKAIENTEDMVLSAVKNPIIYTSDLGRALHTAEILNQKVTGRVVIDSRLRERCFGILEGCVIDQDMELYYEWMGYQARYREKMDGIYGVESEYDFEQRVRSFITTLRFQDASSDVIIVSHGEWLRAFQNIIHDQPSWHKGNGVIENTHPVELVWHESPENKDRVCRQLELPC